MPRPVMWVDPDTLQGKLFQFPWNWVKYSGCHKHCQISIHQLEMCKCSHDGGAINNLVCRRFDQWEQRSGLSLGLGMDTSSNFLYEKFTSLSNGSLWDLVITKDWGSLLNISSFLICTSSTFKTNWKLYFYFGLKQYYLKVWRSFDKSFQPNIFSYSSYDMDLRDRSQTLVGGLMQKGAP